MRILHIIPSISRTRGGTSKAVLDMVKALQEHDVIVEIATTNDDGPDLLDVPLMRCIQYEQVPIRFFPRCSPAIAPIREFAFSRSFTTWLWQHISNYDLLHIHAIFSYTSTIGMKIARIKKIPYVITPHGLLCEWSLQQSAQKKQIYLDWLERDNLNHSRLIHFTSLQEQQDVSALNLTAPSFVLPLGVPLPIAILDAHQRLRQQFNLPLDEPIILFLSRLHYKKGLEYLIPALSKLRHRRFTFILAGSGDPAYEAQIESLLVSTGLRERTCITGFVEGETKKLLLQGSDLFVLTSHSENFGIIVLEALAAGLPVLLTPGVALASMIKEHQLGYISDLDISDIVYTIESYLTHSQEAKEMGKQGYKFICKHYAWAKIVIQLVQTYQRILNQNHLPFSYR